MNKKQKIAIIIGMFLILLMAFFPPYYRSWEYSRESIYGCVLDLGYPNIYILDIQKLYAQWILVVLTVSGFLLLFIDTRKKKNS